MSRIPRQARGVPAPNTDILDQRLVRCPMCHGVSACHLRPVAGTHFELERFVCPSACAVDLAEIAQVLCRVGAP